MEHRLRQGDALALATAWGVSLRGCGAVRLSERPLVAEVDRSRLYWLEISLQSAQVARDREGIRALEEALLVFHALASCAGFSAHLNGQFWVEVLACAGVTGNALDLASAAFDEDFPRFRLKFDAELPDAQQEAELVEQTLACFALGDNASRSPAFKQSMEQLDPLIVCPTRRKRPVQLAVVLPSMDTRWLLPAMERFVANRRECKHDSGIQIQELTLNQRRHKPSDPLEGSAWLEVLAEIPTLSDWTVDEHIEDARVFGKLYRRLLGLGGERVMKIRTLHVDRPSLSDDQFAALCSALPSTRTINTLRIFRDADWDWNLLSSSHDWAWLGYAIFQKQLKRSTLRNLYLDGCSVRVEDASVIELVRLLGCAALPAHIGLTSPHIAQSDVPEENLSPTKTQIKASTGATVWKLQHKHDEDSVLTPLFSVDEVLSTVVLEAIGPLKPLQPVVIPGIGVGYIQREDFTEVYTCTTNGENLLSSLTGFGARLHSWNYGTVAGLKMLVRTLGHSLLSLDLHSHELLAANDVGHVLASCPRLTSIAVNHNGTYWTERHTARRSQFPLLQSLRVSCSMIESYAIVCALSYVSKPAFPSLHELYFHITKASSVFPCVAKALGAFLTENPTISELTMVKARHPTRLEPAVNPNRQSRTLSVMGLSSHDLAAAFHPLNLQYSNSMRQALQPLVDAAADGRGLPNEVVTTIIAFVGDARKRQVWIDLV